MTKKLDALREWLCSHGVLHIDENEEEGLVFDYTNNGEWWSVGFDKSQYGEDRYTLYKHEIPMKTFSSWKGVARYLIKYYDSPVYQLRMLNVTLSTIREMLSTIAHNLSL